MSSGTSIESIQSELAALEVEYRGKREEVLAKVQIRLDEIAESRAALDREELVVRQMIGDDEPAGRRLRRSNVPRVSASQKRDLVAGLIREGHIKDGTELSRGLRAVLIDGGFKAPDFVNLQNYLPDNWMVQKNGERGVLAKSAFKRSG